METICVQKGPLELNIPLSIDNLYVIKYVSMSSVEGITAVSVVTINILVCSDSNKHRKHKKKKFKLVKYKRFC